MRRISRRVVAVCAVATLLAACGGYHGLTKAEFVTQADAICKTYDAKLSALFDHVGKTPTLADVQGIYRDQAIPIFLEEVVQLRKLKPPKDDRVIVKKIFDDLSAGVDQLDAGVRAAKSLDALEAVSPDGLKRASADARGYGLTDCGSS
jgi:hypothetical protein